MKGGSKNDYKVLTTLFKDECNTELKSYTIKNIAELTQLKCSKVRNAVYLFKDKGYIAEGLHVLNAKSYYITDEGNKKLNELLGREN